MHYIYNIFRQFILYNIKIVNKVVSFTISSSPKGEQSLVTDTVMMLVCICSTQAAVKTADDL